MRLFSYLIYPLIPLLTPATALTLRDSNNVLTIPSGGFNFAAGEGGTVSWTNPSSGTITLQLVDVTSGNTSTLTSNIQASNLQAGFIIPLSASSKDQYQIKIIDDSEPSNTNTSPDFTIGANSLATSLFATGSFSTSTSSMTTSTSSVTSSASATPSLQTGSPNPSGSSSLSSGAIAGIAVAGVLVGVLLCVGAFLIYRRRQRRQKKELESSPGQGSQAGMVQTQYPSGSFGQGTPASGYMYSPLQGQGQSQDQDQWQRYHNGQAQELGLGIQNPPVRAELDAPNMPPQELDSYEVKLEKSHSAPQPSQQDPPATSPPLTSSPHLQASLPPPLSSSPPPQPVSPPSSPPPHSHRLS